MRHGGNVMAPDAELADHYAREMYGRRQESVRLWVVRRADILDLVDPDLLQPPLDRWFKKPGGYVMRDKLAAARALSGAGQAEGAIGMSGATVARRPRPRWRAAAARWPMTNSSSASATRSGPGIAPLLEEDVAMSSIAQDELGHAAALYGLLAELTGDGRRRARLRPRARRVPPLPAARPRAATGRSRSPGAGCTTRRRRPARRARRRVVGATGRPRREADPRGALSPDARRSLARPPGPRRRRGARSPARGAARARPGRGDRLHAAPGEPALLEAGVLARPMAELEARWRAASSRSSPGSACRCRRRRAIRRAAGSIRRRLPLAVGRVHLGPPVGPGGGVVSAAEVPGVPESAAAARRPVAGRRPALDERPSAPRCRGDGPELPMSRSSTSGSSIASRSTPRCDGPIRVEILPTFVGCPALELIRRSIADRLAAFGRPVEVDVTFAVPWTTDRISAEGGAASGAPGSRRRAGLGRRRAGGLSRSSRASPARTAARDGPASRTRSARPSAARSTTARTAASRSKRSSRSDRGRPPGCQSARLPYRRRSSVPGRWAPASPRSRSKPATRSFSTTSTRRRSSAAVLESGGGLGRRAARLEPRRRQHRRLDRRSNGPAADARTLDAVGAEAEIVIEAALEDLELKRTIFRVARCRRRRPTSSSPRIRARCRSRRSRPERPIRGGSLASTSSTRRRSWRSSRSPVGCADSPGFIVNRVNRPFTIEALRMLESGAATVEAIDAAMRDDGFPLGPFELIDLTGSTSTSRRRPGVWEGLGRPDRLRPAHAPGGSSSTVAWAARRVAGSTGTRSARGGRDPVEPEFAGADEPRGGRDPFANPGGDRRGGAACRRRGRGERVRHRPRTAPWRRASVRAVRRYALP